MENARQEINSPPASPENGPNHRVMQQAARAFALERATIEARARRNRGRAMGHRAVNPATRTPAQRFEDWSLLEQTYHRDWINEQFEDSLENLGPLARGYDHNIQIERRLLQDGLPGDVSTQLSANRLSLLHEAAQEARRSVMTLQRMIRDRAEHNERFVTRDNAYMDLRQPYGEAQAQIEAAAIILMACIEDL
nr:hypothetical protein [Sweet potato pakakuy virus]